ncbi:MAG TPA: biotin/lipoyl-containing protein, partial [Candidatus Angelobacter sp.]|nr:biotin/lipoyl-containing protein [Candidatus Angelobacter sp.]
GFLSENADFADAVVAAGLVWIGPSPASMRAMGRKVETKRIAAGAGVPLVPGAELAPDATDEDVLAAADRVGYPVLVKASAGGGGKGMRVVRTPDALVEAVAGARREALSSFGDPEVFLERHLENARHVEVQVFGDAHGEVVHLFERECSIQRRHQKIVEESPSPGAAPSTLEGMYAAAVALARSIGYVGAGTVEFLVSGEGAEQEFFFLEMNTRLQVEHPVTEAVTGLDLVAWQVAVARGEPLPLPQGGISRTGHAIEVRLYAEDPSRDFLPSTGVLESWDLPGGDGAWSNDDPGPDAWLRVDTGYDQGCVVSSLYDPLLAKVIAHGDSRADVAAGLAAYLRNLAVLGVTTNQHTLAAILDHEAFLAGRTTTDFLVRHPEVLAAGVPGDVRADHLLVAALVLVGAPGFRNVTGVAETVRVAYRDGADDVVAVLGGSWDRDGAVVWALPRVDDELDPHAAQALSVRDDLVLTRGARLERLGEPAADGFAAYRLEREGVRSGVFVRHSHEDAAGETVSIDDGDLLTTYRVLPLGAGTGHGDAGGGPTTPVPGTVTHVAVTTGDVVTAGAALVVLEAMKMEHTVRADVDGVVAEVHVTVGQAVDAHTVVATLTPHGEPA